MSRLTIKPPEVFNKEYIFGIRTNLLNKHLILVWNFFAVTNHLHFDREPFLCLHICATTGESNQMEKPWWAHGRPDHQRGASDAPGGVPRGPQAGSVEGDFSLWRCLRPAGDALWTQPGQTGESTWLLLARSRFARFDFGLILSVLSVYQPLQAEGESSALRDGSLVDLCGATLLWRTGEGLMRAPTLRHLEALRQELNASRPQCPVGLSTLAFPSLPRSHRWEPLS